MVGIFGIDLGTTDSAVAYLDDTGRPVVVRNHYGDQSTPSAVFFETESNVVVGKAAKRCTGQFPGEVVLLNKRLMGDRNYARTFFGREYGAAMVTAVILSALVKDAERATGQAARRVAVSVPACFGLLERDAIRKAAEIAGLDLIGLVPEPVAAALACGLTSWPDGTTVLVYDLGSGTFESTLIRVTGSSVEVLAADGSLSLGGVEWDERLLASITQQVTATIGEALAGDDAATLEALRHLAETTKQSLSSADSVTFKLPLAGLDTTMTVTREKFEKITIDLLEESVSITNRMLDAAEIRDPGVRGRINEMLLVGGSSRMPAVAMRLRREFPWHIRVADPDLAVAKGAAVYAAARASQAPTGQLAGKAFVNVLPKAVGIKLVDTSVPGWAEQMQSASYVEHLVPAQSRLPYQSEVFTAATTVDNQDAIEFELWEQSSAVPAAELAANRRLDHDGRIDGLAPFRLPSGSPLNFTIDVDADGAARLVVVEPASGKRLALNVSTMSGDQLEQQKTDFAALSVSGTVSMRQSGPHRRHSVDTNRTQESSHRLLQEPQRQRLAARYTETARAHLNFDLLFTHADHGYRALVTTSPAGEGQSVAFDAPFSELELENFVLRVGRFRLRSRRVEDPLVVRAKETGQRLFDTIFSGPVGECLRRSRDRAEQDQATLRIRLQFGTCPELSNVPWELLYDRSEDWFLALSGRTPVIRYTQLPFLARKVQAELPLRILVIKSEPADSEPLDLAAEWAQVAGALGDLTSRGLVSITELAAPTLSELRRTLLLDTFHVLHFMGHGSFHPDTGGTLLFADSAGRGQPVTADALGVMLYDHSSMRLAVLNACEAARTDAADPFAGVADTLIRRGIPAVVAMQFEITDRAAIAFAPALYGALAAGFPIETAVAEARKEMHTVSALEWVTPVLHLRADDGQLFDVSESVLLQPPPAETGTGTVQDPPPLLDSLPVPQSKEAEDPAARQAPSAEPPEIRQTYYSPQTEIRPIHTAKAQADDVRLDIALIGARGSGKTVMTTILIRLLRKDVAQRFGADSHFATVTPGGYRGASNYQWCVEDPLWAEGILPLATPSALSSGEHTAKGEYTGEPVFLRWRQEVTRPLRAAALRTTLMSLTDVSSADLADLNAMFQHRYLAKSNALIIAIDPLSLPGAPIRHGLPSAALINPDYEETLDVIARTTELLRTELTVSASERIRIPVAVVVTKIDAFYHALDGQSPVMVVPRADPAYNEADGRLVHEQVRDLLTRWGAADIDIHMRLHYSDYRYFAVSALGAEPDYEHGRGAAERVHPHRIEEPALWLMSRYESVRTA